MEMCEVFGSNIERPKYLYIVGSGNQSVDKANNILINTGAKHETFQRLNVRAFKQTHC